MALVVDSQLDALAEDIVPPLPAEPTPEQTAGRAQAVAETKTLCQKIFQYMVNQMEIKGVTVDLDAGNRTLETFVTGVGSNGGSLNSAVPSPVSGSVKDSKASTSTQNNDGKGRVL